MKRLIWFLALQFLVSGCGYHPVGRQDFPDGVETVSIALFENRTLEPFLENEITDRVVEEFSRRRGLCVVEQSLADAILSGAVTDYHVEAISYNPDDRIGQFRLTMTINASLMLSDTGKTLWKGLLSWSEEYPINSDKNLQEDNENAATALISKRLAENLYFRIIERF